MMAAWKFYILVSFLLGKIDGLRGPPGEPGMVGMMGMEGYKGLPGSDGRKGEKGEPELNCLPNRVVKGTRGFPGRPGTKGDSGEKGFYGIPGMPGQEGDKGKRGALCFTGHQDPADVMKIWNQICQDNTAEVVGQVKQLHQNINDLQLQLDVIASRLTLHNNTITRLENDLGETKETDVESSSQSEVCLTNVLKAKIQADGETQKLPCLASLEGIPGLPGVKGERGFPGRPGLKGIKGMKGEKGKLNNDCNYEFIPGDPGFPGLPGPKGNMGEKGGDGTSGLMHFPGDKGEHGSFCPSETHDPTDAEGVRARICLKNSVEVAGQVKDIQENVADLRKFIADNIEPQLNLMNQELDQLENGTERPAEHGRNIPGLDENEDNVETHEIHSKTKD